MMTAGRRKAMHPEVQARHKERQKVRQRERQTGQQRERQKVHRKLLGRKERLPHTPEVPRHRHPASTHFGYSQRFCRAFVFFLGSFFFFLLYTRIFFQTRSTTGASMI